MLEVLGFPKEICTERNGPSLSSTRDLHGLRRLTLHRLVPPLTLGHRRLGGRLGMKTYLLEQADYSKV